MHLKNNFSIKSSVFELVPKGPLKVPDARFRTFRGPSEDIPGTSRAGWLYTTILLMFPSIIEIKLLCWCKLCFSPSISSNVIIYLPILYTMIIFSFFINFYNTPLSSVKSELSRTFMASLLLILLIMHL